MDGINTLPVETEKPIVSKFLFRGGVMQIVLSGDTSERTLKELGQDLRDRLVGSTASLGSNSASRGPTRYPWK